MRILITFFLLVCASPLHAQLKTNGINANGSVSIGDRNDPVASAVLDVKSTTKGTLLPRVTTVQRNAISSPATGLLVYDTDIGDFYQYNGGWQKLPSGTVSIAEGGTNSTAALNNNRVMVSSGGAIVERSALSASLPMKTDANGLPTAAAINFGTAAETTGLVPSSKGGTGIDSSASNGIAKLASGVWSFSTVNVGTEITGTLAIGNGGTGQTTANAALAALSPMTTKGDIISRSSTVPTRVGVGANGTSPIADSTNANGWAWSNPQLTTNSSSTYRIESAYVSCSATPSIPAQTGTWITGITGASGTCTLTITGFAARPNCTTSIGQSGGTNTARIGGATFNATTITIVVWNTVSGAAADDGVQIICMGTRS
jgi:hypothetical protein